MRGSCSPVKDGGDAGEKLLHDNIKRNNAKLLSIYETWKTRVKAWIKDAEKPDNADPRAGKTVGRLHILWAARDTELKELGAENKKLKAKI